MSKPSTQQLLEAFMAQTTVHPQRRDCSLLDPQGKAFSRGEEVFLKCGVEGAWSSKESLFVSVSEGSNFLH